MIQEFSMLLCDGVEDARMTSVKEREMGDVKISQERECSSLVKLSRSMSIVL